ncbi:2-acyl-glycerophospho-ethanolamine acyltransferase [Clavibacter michiganensis subsp. michiganensis]|uniref:2-acyl-glycerophospho-ethanolamine acyltransferase n=1 Tax=Clavibacter michiganensis subsp. michiganensis TaxID=33013 RepID=A0A251XDW1_CLAMM|nr:2-acyl-glycerophospho-ethanolamine acyltransferase [Clavibacter michiganensis subsp. michiganensis]OUE00514.1 2-acyl-glycerophospho-ethanolamine acyltransferase [Clavibacter michiganensis subsp. michiganensis]
MLAATVTVWLATGLAPGDPALPLYIGAVIGATSLPRLVLAPIAGVLVDRWPARRVMVAADLARAALLVPLMVIAVTGPTPLVIAAVIATQLVIGCVSQLFDPARAALVQVVVPADRRAAAAGRSLLASTGVGILSGLTGPAVYALLGPEPALVMDAVSFLASAALVLAVRERGATAADAGSRAAEGDAHAHAHAHGTVASAGARLRAELAAGIRIVLASPRLRVLVAGLAAYGVTLGVNNATLALLALTTMGLTAAEYGVVTAMFAVGGLVGALTAPALVTAIRPERAVPAALVALGATYAAYSTVRAFLPAAFLMGIAGLVFAVFLVSQGPILQAEAPVGTMGRVSSLTSTVLAASSLLATVVTAQVLALLPPPAQPSAYPVAVATAAVVMGSAGLALVAGGLSRGRGPAAAAS